MRREHSNVDCSPLRAFIRVDPSSPLHTISGFEMMYKIFGIILLATLAVAKIPSFIQICGRKNPKLDDCIKNSIYHIQNKLSEGIPEMDVPGVNPLVVKDVTLADLPNFKARADNVKIYGLHQYTINHLHLDLEKKTIEVEITFDKVKIEADYNVNARILIPVNGRGPIQLDADKVKGKLLILYKIIQRNGKNYMYFYSMTVKIDVGDFKATFQAEGDSDNTLSTAINVALVDSRQEILDNSIPHIEKKISESILEISNKISKHFTYEELFPDRE